MPEPLPLWTPPSARQAHSRMRRFLDETDRLTYDSAWAWSVEDIGGFWSAVAVHFDLPLRGPAVLPDAAAVPGVSWFPDALLNYAEVMLRPAAERPGDVAVVAFSDTRPPEELSWGELAGRVAAARAGLRGAGVGRGDAVAGYLPNVPETLVAMLATASLGATWTCCAPEMGVDGTLDRLSQVAPKVLLAVDGYRYGSRAVDRREEVAAIAAGLPSVERLVEVPYLRPGDGWGELTASAGPLDFDQVPFDHPLYVLFSSGTTGKPKGIVHGHGGILLEHAKALGLHFDLGPADRFFWYSTTGWMMWNFAVSGLLLGSTVVLYDGEPGRIWEVMETAGVTCGGVGAAFLVSCAKSGVSPRVPSLATLGSTGSPLPAAAAEWVYRSVGGDLMLASFSGGTDVCTGFVGTSPLHPVWAGEISCRCLGAKVEVFDDAGRPVVGEEGELVLTAPMPSMPVGILGDADGSRYRSTYFERFVPEDPGAYPVWAHGDRATLTERGTVVISGRSDGTLNRGGVRIGTAEIYEVVEGLPEVQDSLAVHVEDPAGGPGRLLLFVVLAPGSDLAAVRENVRSQVRSRLSPRYVPDEVEAVPAVPRTLSGKKLEVPVKRILSGMPVEEAVSLAAVAEPASLEPFARLAGRNLSP